MEILHAVYIAAGKAQTRIRLKLDLVIKLIFIPVRMRFTQYVQS
jgi:hypothetical protein